MEDLLLLAPLVTGIIQALKEMGFPSKYSPLLAILLGLGASFGLAYDPATLENVVLGLAIGLSAVGFYEASSRSLSGLLSFVKRGGNSE